MKRGRGSPCSLKLKSENDRRQPGRSGETQGAAMTAEPRLLDTLCAPLRLILSAELAAGNQIAQFDADSGDAGPMLVILAFPFRTKPNRGDPDIVFREINIHGMWKSQYLHVPTGHVLACGFGNG